LSQTVSGKWSTLVGNIEQSAVQLFDRLKPMVNKLLDMVMAAVPPVFDAVQRLFDGIGKLVDWVKKWQVELTAVGAVVAVATVVLSAHNIALAVYAAGAKAVAVATQAWTAVQWLLNAAMSANPIGLIIIGVAAVAAAVWLCWQKFAGFRAVILTLWDSLRGFGSALKTFVLDRITSLLRGIGKLGDALRKLFKGDFKGAWSSAVEGAKDIAGGDDARKAGVAISKAVDKASLLSDNYHSRLAQERLKDKVVKATPTLSTPGLKGSEAETEKVKFGAAKGKNGKTANAVATGGVRNTSITMTIGKLFDNINVTMADKADTAELERTVVQAMNRALAIATSTDR
jgi:phage-related protein